MEGNTHTGRESWQQWWPRTVCKCVLVLWRGEAVRRSRRAWPPSTQELGWFGKGDMKLKLTLNIIVLLGAFGYSHDLTAPSHLPPQFELHATLFVTAWRGIQTDVGMIVFFMLWVVPQDPDDTQSTRNPSIISPFVW